MNTDRELLEAAAKAAGVDGEYRTENLCLDGDWIDVTAIFLSDDQGWWNPLTDDGDALRLAVDLYLEVAPCPALPQVGRPNPCTIVCDGEPASFRVEESGPDAYANTRRAIVRVAATKPSVNLCAARASS